MFDLGRIIFYNLVLAFVCSLSSCESVRLCKAIDQCSCKYSDTGKIVTLWGIDDPNEPRFHNQPLKDLHVLDYNPCTPFNEGDNTAHCDNDLVCIHKRDDSKYYSAGKYYYFYSEIVKGNLYFHYGGQKYAKGESKSTKILLQCDPKAKQPTLSNLLQKDNQYSFTLKTECACPGVCSVRARGHGSNLSVGSILLIIFFVFFAAYFIFGHLFLKYYRNLGGESTIPNYEVWREFPTNIKEGFKFTKEQLCTRHAEYENI